MEPLTEAQREAVRLVILFLAVLPGLTFAAPDPLSEAQLDGLFTLAASL